MCSLRFKTMMSIFNHFQKPAFLALIQEHMCSFGGDKMAGGGGLPGQEMLWCNTSWVVDEG